MQMQDPALALVAICGFSVICIGLVAVLALIALRVTGRSIGGLLGGQGLFGLVDSVSGASDPEESPIRAGRRRATPANDLRAKAQSLDFDAAVQRYKEQPPSASSTPGNPYPPLQTDPDRDPNSQDSLRRKRRRRGEDDADADEMFGGFLDEIDPF
jgi:hypothetical protein